MELSIGGLTAALSFHYYLELICVVYIYRQSLPSSLQPLKNPIQPPKTSQALEKQLYSASYRSQALTKRLVPLLPLLPLQKCPPKSFALPKAFKETSRPRKVVPKGAGELKRAC